MRRSVRPSRPAGVDAVEESAADVAAGADQQHHDRGADEQADDRVGEGEAEPYADHAGHDDQGGHFTPTSSSWLNQVEHWFRDLTDKNLRRGIFASVPDLIASIQTYIDASNAVPKPYVWTATAESILAKVARARNVLDQRINQN